MMMPHQEVISLHKRLVRIPSLSGEERVVADFVEAHVLERGIETRRLDDNVYFWIGDGDHTLLLTTHLDVVPPSADHPFDPFGAVEQDGRIYGRGSVDAKASAAARAGAVRAVGRGGFRPQHGGVVVAFSTE